MLLENNNLKLRALEPLDLEILYNWENNTEIWGVSNTLVPYSKYILRQYIENSHQDISESKQIRLIIELKFEIPVAIGTIDLFDIDFHNQKAGIGILVAEKEHRNRGYAGEAIEIIKEYVLKNLNLRQLFCHIDEDNLASIKLFEKAGFEIVGTLKDWKKHSSAWKNVLILQNILS